MTCLTYFVLMGVLTLFSSYKEKSIFMVALEKNKAGLVRTPGWSSFMKEDVGVKGLMVSI